MNRTDLCLERIRVIRGVGYGNITHEQLQYVFEMYSLSEEEKIQVCKTLEEKGVRFVTEETAQVLRRKEEIIMNAAYHKMSCETEEGETAKRARFEQALQKCLEMLKDNEKLTLVYEQEAELLKKALSETGISYYSKPEFCISDSVSNVFAYSEHRGWQASISGCGAYIDRQCERYERWLALVFSEEDMWYFVNECAESEILDTFAQKMMLVILYGMHEIIGKSERRPLPGCLD